MVADPPNRYRAMLAAPDPATRRLAEVQLGRLQQSAAIQPNPASARTRSGSVVQLIEQTVGPLHRRPSGVLEGSCPWHTSKSGRCLLIFPEGTRWFCRSCRRGGDAVVWVASTEGITLKEARRRLGLPYTSVPAPIRRRPTLRSESGS